MDRGTAEPAEVLGDGVVLDRAARRACSIEVDPSAIAAVETKLDAVRSDVAAHYGLPLDTREGPGFLRYAEGGFYRRHCDRAAESAWPGASRRQVSLVVFLNSSRSASPKGEFSGGELVIFQEEADGRQAGEPIRIVPRQGCLVAFHAAMAHEVRPVAHGARDVIVDWFY